MRFGTVGQIDPGMRQVGLGIGKVEGVILGANVGHPIVTNGDFAVYLCLNARTTGAAVWGGA